MYEHTQLGYVTVPLLVGGALLAGVLAARADRWISKGGGLALTTVLLVGAVLFSSLTVTVNEQAVRFFFGPGFWEQRVPHEDVQQVRVVQNPVWYGWGIRYTPDGWVYNVSGLRAVELTVASEERIRIGTDEPGALKQALEEASHP